jgi:predicted enzyme related to lactoylglutathione lyase
MTKTLLKRFDTLEVATADLADAVATYQHNFGFTLAGEPAGESATLKVGGAEIRLLAGSAAAPMLASGGEGLAALWLEAQDVDQVAAALASAGTKPPAIRVESGRRILAIDPKLANQVPLFIFDRKA